VGLWAIPSNLAPHTSFDLWRLLRRLWQTPAERGPLVTGRCVRGCRASSLGRGTVSDRRHARQPVALFRVPVVRVVPLGEGRRHHRLLVGRGRCGLAAARDGNRRLAPARAGGPASDPAACTHAPPATGSGNIARTVRRRARRGSRTVGLRARRVVPRHRLRQPGTRGCPQSTAWRVRPSLIHSPTKRA